MTISEVCIRRPVFTWVLVAIPVVLGIVAYGNLGVDLFPNVDFPVCTVTTVLQGAGVEEMPFLDFSSGYVQRALPLLPKQGTRSPWRLHQNYAKDTLALRFGSIDDEMVFSSPEPGRQAA